MNNPSVLVASDLSPLGNRAISEAIRIANGYGPDSVVHVVCVVPGADNEVVLPGSDKSQLRDDALETLKSNVDELVRAEAAAGNTNDISQVFVHLVEGSPVDGILLIANAERPRLIVAGTHGRAGWKRLALGSVAELLIRRADCSVLIVKPDNFLNGEPLPEIEPALLPGQSSMHPVAHRHTYSYSTKNLGWSKKTMNP